MTKEVMPDLAVEILERICAGISTRVCEWAWSLARVWEWIRVTINAGKGLAFSMGMNMRKDHRQIARIRARIRRPNGPEAC